MNTTQFKVQLLMNRSGDRFQRDFICIRNFTYVSLSIPTEKNFPASKKNSGNFTRRLSSGQFDRASYLIHRESISLILQGRGSDRSGVCRE